MSQTTKSAELQKGFDRNLRKDAVPVRKKVG